MRYFNAIIFTLFLASAASAYVTPPNGYCGNPPGSQYCTQCHGSYALNSGNGSVQLTGLPVDGFVPNQTYSLTLTLADPGQSRWAFEVTCQYLSGTSWVQGGTFTVTQSNYTTLSQGTGSAPDYMKNNSSGTFQGTPGPTSWRFDWTAPEGAVPSVNFYFTGAACNGSGTGGDYIYAQSTTVAQYTPPPPQPPVVSDIPSQQISYFGLFADIYLDDYVSDPDTPDDQITWTFSGNNAISVMIVDRVAYISSEAGWWGSETITFTATDPTNLSDSDDAVFTVDSAFPPVVSDIPDQIQSYLAGWVFQPIYLDDYVEDPDTPDSLIAWSVPDPSIFQVDIIDRVAIVQSNITMFWYGTYTITFYAYDPDSLFDSDDVSFTITAYPPVVSDIPDQTIFLGDSFAPINLSDYVEDPDTPDSMIVWEWYNSGPDHVDIQVIDQIAYITPLDPDWTGSDIVLFTAHYEPVFADSDYVTFTVLPLSVGSVNPGKIPSAYSLNPAYPNPFNPSTTISFALPHASNVDLVVYDASGRRMMTLCSGNHAPGYYNVTADFSRFASGIYLVSLKAQDYSAVQKIVLIK